MIRASKNVDTEIIVVDNHSSDGSREFFRGRYREARFIWNEQNLGFAKANNEALRLATGKYVLFLNPDTLIPEDCFQKCLAFIQSNNDQCALGVKMLDGSGRFLKESRRSFPDPKTSLYKLSGLAALFPKSPVFARYYLGHLDRDQTHETDVLAGAFIMSPIAILNEVNGFDEEFFMYGEDVDLSFRIQKAGYKNFYFSDTTIIHFKGESTKKGSLNYVKMFYKAMSIFVKKHYGTSRAGVYNLFIQAGIALRACLSAFTRFIRWIGLPAIDALLILLSFWMVKSVWATAIRPGIDFTPHMLWIAFPSFTILFLVTSYYTGLYDNGYEQSRLNTATIASTLVLFTVYALLPESAKFSRGILFFSILCAYLLVSLLRIILSAAGVIARKRVPYKPFIAIAGSTEEAAAAMAIIKSSGKDELVLGRIAVEHTAEEKSALGSWKNLPAVFRSGMLKKIIYCQGALSYKEIIESTETLPQPVVAAFYTPQCHSIIESQDKDASGTFISSSGYFRLGNPVYRRMKRLLDFCIALFFIATFFVHMIIKKHSVRFFKNIFSVLANRKTFVGYAEHSEGLPPLKSGVLTTTGFPASENTLPRQALYQSDRMYALHYSVIMDLTLVWNHYSNL